MMDRIEKLQHHYLEILKLLGEDPTREGLVKTPLRVAKAMQTLTRGYEMDPKEVLLSANLRSPTTNGNSKRHQLLLALRTSHAPFLRQSTCGLHTQRIYNGII